MSRRIVLIALAVTTSSALAERATFRFRGYVESETPSSYSADFDVGDTCTGEFSVNLDDFSSVFNPATPQYGFSYTFRGVTFRAQVGSWSRDEANLLMFAVDDASFGTPFPSPDRLNDLASLKLAPMPGRSESLYLFFQAPTTWLGNGLEVPESLESLNLASVTHAVLFSSPNFPENVKIVITSLSRDGFGLLATPNQRVAQFAEPNAVLDIFDLFGFLAALDAQDPSADLAAPLGSFDVFDLFQFLEEAALVPTE